MNNTRKIPTDLLEELDKRLLSYSRPGNLYILLQVQKHPLKSFYVAYNANLGVIFILNFKLARNSLNIRDER